MEERKKPKNKDTWDYRKKSKQVQVKGRKVERRAQAIWLEKNVQNDLEVPPQLLDQLYKQNLVKNMA